MMRTSFSLAHRLLCTFCLVSALAGVLGCSGGDGPGDLERRVRAAELERDALREEIATLRADLTAATPSVALTAEQEAIRDELAAVRAASARTRTEMKNFKEKFPIPGELVGR